MGLQGLVLFVLLCAVVLFVGQNLTPLALFFFGFNSPSLPLSVWVILSFAAGFISSWLIGLLSYNPPPVTAKTTATPRRETEDIPPPEAEVYTPPRQSQRSTDIPPEEDEAIPSYYFDNTDQLPEDSLAQNQTPASVIPSSHTNTTESPPKYDKAQKSDEEQWPKPRQAATYSYTPRERTVIRVKPSPDSASNPPDVYDAPYRLISPPLDESPTDEDDDDWDF